MSAEITQEKLILLSGREFENSFCTVVISHRLCLYAVIWRGSASTLRKHALTEQGYIRCPTLPDTTDSCLIYTYI